MSPPPDDAPLILTVKEEPPLDAEVELYPASNVKFPPPAALERLKDIGGVLSLVSLLELPDPLDVLPDWPVAWFEPPALSGIPPDPVDPLLDPPDPSSKPPEPLPELLPV